MTTPSESELLPCPWCGNEPYRDDKGWFGCPNSACPASVVHTSKYSWNTRAIVKAHDGTRGDVVEALRGFIDAWEDNESESDRDNKCDAACEKAKASIAALGEPK